MQTPSLSPRQASEHCKSSLPEGLEIFGEFHPLGGRTGQKNPVWALVALENNQKWALLAPWVGQGQNGVKN